MNGIKGRWAELTEGAGLTEGRSLGKDDWIQLITEQGKGRGLGKWAGLREG